MIKNKPVCQKGATLILLTFLLAIAITSYLLFEVTSNQYLLKNDTTTAKALAEAKSALLAWATLQSTPGQLPCPEDTTLIGLPTEGSAKSSCTLPAIGRLPWRTIGIGDIRDGNGDKLWYVISNGFRTAPINSQTSLGQLTVNGVSAVAIVFSAGMPLSTQVRTNPTSSSAPDVRQYLDAENNNGDNIFISGVANAQFNDKLIVLTKNELFLEVSQRILRLIRGDATQGLNYYYLTNSNKYPFADVNSDGVVDANQLSGTVAYNPLIFNDKKSLSDNAWFPLITYQVSPNQKNVTLSLNGKSLTLP